MSGNGANGVGLFEVASSVVEKAYMSPSANEVPAKDASSLGEAGEPANQSREAAKRENKLGARPTPTKPKTESEHSEKIRVAKLQGYEGDPCGNCGAFTLVRNGVCLKCQSCGETSGCS